MLTTQAFADLCQTTKRTIIHYDQLGLLKPTKREKLNRYYAQRQILKFEKIALLQSVGFPLKEIRKKLASHQTLTQIFQDNKQKIAEKQRKINEQMKKIDEILTNLEKNKNILDPQIVSVKPYNFYGIEREGKYVDLPVYCEELARLLNDKQFRFTYFVIFTDFFAAGYSPVKSKMIIGAKVPNQTNIKLKADVKKFHVPAHAVITSLHKGSYRYLGYVWEFMEDYMKKNKLTADPLNQPKEIYTKIFATEKHDENYLTELQIPIK